MQQCSVSLEVEIMIGSVILLAVVACAQAQTLTVLYVGHDAQRNLDGKKPSDVFTIPAGECDAYYSIEQIGCYHPYTHTYMDLQAIKVEVEADFNVIIDAHEPISEIHISRHLGHCDTPATVTITKQCMLGAIGPNNNKRPAYRQKGYAMHY